MSKTEKAKELFLGAYNCAQSTLSVFANDLNIDVEKALAISAGFGAGLGYQGKTCGVVTGAYMALGLHSGNLYTDAEMVKENTYQLTKEFKKHFVSMHGTTSCKELIGFDLSTEEGIENGKQAGVFKSKCPMFVETAVSLIEELINE